MSTLRVGTLNVWALPLVARRVEERLRATVDRAAALNLDVLALQEVWSQRAESVLVEAGAAVGYQSLWPSGRAAGGLMALSRLEATSVEFTEFAVAGLPQRVQHADYYGHKGYAVARLGAAGGSVVLVVTHLHARYAAPDEPDEYRGIRSAQIAELAGRIKQLSDPIVAVGDFNIREGEPEYDYFVGLTGLVDAAADLDRREDTVVTANPYVGAGHHGDERIDYVFVNRAVEPVTLSRDFHEPLGQYSDHAGVVATIGLSELPGAADVSADVDPALRKGLRGLLNEGRSEALRRRRQHRWRAAGLLVGSGLACRMRERAAAGLLLAGAFGELLLAERFVRAELQGLDFAQEIVNELNG